MICSPMLSSLIAEPWSIYLQHLKKIIEIIRVGFFQLMQYMIMNQIIDYFMKRVVGPWHIFSPSCLIMAVERAGVLWAFFFFSFVEVWNYAIKTLLSYMTNRQSCLVP